VQTPSGGDSPRRITEAAQQVAQQERRRLSAIVKATSIQL